MGMILFPQNLKLHPEKPLICLEVNPPRGVEVDAIFERLEGEALNGIDFVNITDCALARMKLAALTFAAIFKSRFNIEPLVNVSCRDRNIIALQADLLGAWASGIRSIIALTGDAVSIGDMPESKGVFEINSLGLLNLVNTLNSGRDMAGNGLKGAPNFTSGVVVNPNARNSLAEVKRLKRKKEAGAKYALSQPVFDIEAAKQFLNEAASVEIPIFLGLMALKNSKAVNSISKVPGIRVSNNILEYANSHTDQDLSGFFLDFCLKLADGTKKLVSGFHVVCGISPTLGGELAKRLVSWRG